MAVVLTDFGSKRKKGDKIMAGFTEMTGGNFEQLLRGSVSTPMNRAAAAALTVAFQIRKADHLSRGEQDSDDSIKEEVSKIYIGMLAITDPEMGRLMAQQAAQKKRTP
jgi:hypothetical protein